MAIVTKQYVVTRPDTTEPFGNWTVPELAAYSTALNELPINAITIYSADGLTRTRIESYDDSLEPTIAALQAKYADALKAEGDRRIAAKFVGKSEELATPPAAIDPTIVSVSAA